MSHKYIGLQGILDLLGGAKGREGGEYKCICPAHDDHKPSLYVREGDKGIIMNCVAGCDTKDICARLGISMADLFRDAPEGKGRPRTRTPAPAKAQAPAPAKDDKQAKIRNSYAEAYNYNGNQFVKAYPYTDSKGALLFEVARLRKPDGGKDFRQHRPVKPDGSGKCAFPIRLDVPAELRDNTVYRQPEVEAAVAAGKTVYIVEGEKDADTMAALGLTATTNPGGAGKWKDGHTAHLKGAAAVVIIADNDGPGENHVRKIYPQMLAAARSAYMIHLTDGYEELKEKGDFTDLVEAVGASKALEILDTLVDEAQKAPESLREKAEWAYSGIPGYKIVNGAICQMVDDETAKRLCNFVALPLRELTIDDGMKIEKRMEIAGWRANGEPFNTINIPIEQYKGLDWAFNNWGIAANIMPGTTLRDRLRYVIQEAGAKVTKYETSYLHFGWRKINGNWCYLHHTGCIGQEDVHTEFNDRLKNYGLDGWPEGMDTEEAAFTSYRLLDLVSKPCSVPLLGITYLAPLCEFLEDRRCDSPPSFVTMLSAEQGTGKSTIAALFLSHFGHFNYQNLPANFHNTANSIRMQAFIAKDSLFCIDDYHPEDTPQAQRRIVELAQTLARAFGDHADRARLTQDMKLQKSMPPRCLAMITGEEPPRIGQSGMARYYTIRIDKMTFPRTENGAEILKMAREGALRMAMSKYIEWLAGQADTLPDTLRELFDEYKEKAHDMIHGAATSDRADEAAAHIMIGLTMMNRWLIHLDLTDVENAERTQAEWWDVVIDNIKEQGRVSKTETPVNMFLDAVRSMISGGVVWVEDLTDGAKNTGSSKPKLGWVDSNNYYLDPPMAYNQVYSFYRGQETVFPIGKDTLWGQLEKEGIIVETDKTGKKTPKNKSIHGRPHRCLWIPRWHIDGSKPVAKQEAMDFQEVHEEIPDEFK